MNMNKAMYLEKEQEHCPNCAEAGVTLMELIAALSVIAVIIIGALALYGSATSSQASTQLMSDITSLRGSVKTLWLGQGTYGANGTDLVPTLVAANKVPTTVSSAGGVLRHAQNGNITIVSSGAGATFTMTLTNIPKDICIPLLTSAQGWESVTGTGGASYTSAAAALPVSPANASDDATCADTRGTMTFVGN